MENTISNDEIRKICSECLNGSSSVEELEKIIELSKIYFFTDITVKAIIKQGEIFFRRNDYRSAYKRFISALGLIKINQEKSLLCNLYNKLGCCKSLLMEYEEAQIYYNKAYIEAKREKIEDVMMKVNYNIVLCYYESCSYDIALKWIEKFINKFETETYFKECIVIEMIRGACYKDKGDLEYATDILKNLVEIIEDKSEYGYTQLLAEVYSKLGATEQENGHIEKAARCYDNSFNLWKRTEQSKGICGLIEKAKLYMINEKYEEAIETIQSAIKESKKENDEECVMESYEFLESIYLKMKRYDELEATIKASINEWSNSNSKLKNLNCYLKLQKLYFKNREYDKAYDCLKSIENLIKEVS